MTSTRQQDSEWMLRALSLAAEGQGHVEPNPMVGCVIVTKNQIEIGSGFHERFGGPHAERNAIQNAVERGNESQLPGSTVYVTLEPCCHHGKTPPCTEALLQAKVHRVVIGAKDPFPQVDGGGIDELKKAGIDVQFGVEEQLANELLAPYLTRLLQNRPWIIGKWAMTLDGKIATHKKDSRWISSPTSRHYVHELRGRVDAIMVGIGTALADDPMLTARGESSAARIATRVVLDSESRLPLDSKLVQTCHAYPTLLAVGPDADGPKCKQLTKLGVEVLRLDGEEHAQRLAQLLRFLAEEKRWTNILCEGGGELLGGLHDLGYLDELEVFIAPKIVGGLDAPSPLGGSGLSYICDASEFRLLEQQFLEDDIHARYRRA